MIAYAISHPQLSEPLVMESEVERTDKALAAWTTLHVLRTFDVMLEPDLFTVEVTT